ncbi:MAG: helicase HerA-like domain-containing protein [Phycisphaerae bacterium]
MSIIGKLYLIPLIKGKTDLLRIPKELAKDLADSGIHSSVNCICSNRDKHKLSVRINIQDRTIIGLEPWLRELKDEDIKSLSLEGENDTPCSFGFNFSKELPPPVEDIETFKILHPEQGLYLGSKLLPEFFELLRTNEAASVEESDLLKQVFICGAIGSGKTVLAKIFIEEATNKGIPVIAIDLKGDISSMGVVFSGEDSSELIPWVTPRKDESIEAKAATIAEEHKMKLQRCGLIAKDVDEFKKNVAVNVFTPRSNAGFRLAFSAFVEPPEDLEKLKEKDPDSFESVIGFMAETFVSRLTLTKKKTDKARGYIYEIIKTFWDKGESLRGYNGIKQVLDEIKLGYLGIEQIGGMDTDEYISQKDREEIASAINALLIGPQKLWFQGFPLNIEELINPNNYDGKTPLTIINIKHLNFQDQAYVVGYIAYLIWFWMRGLKGDDKPRLIFYIDEIGGGGSKEAFFPSVAISPSKPALNLLLRQGRAFGVCCIFATQSPGDIDYRALGQCGTWAVGQLRTDRDRQKIKQGAGVAELDFETASQFIPVLNTGQFVIKSPSLPWTIIEERWLMHLHRVLSQEDLERLKDDYEKEVHILFEESQKCANANDRLTAKNLLESIIRCYRFSALCPKAYLLFGKVLYDMSDYDSAIKKLNEMLKNRMEAEESGEAYFLLGKCKEQIGHFDNAAIDFARVAGSAANEEIKSIAFNHEQYCKNRTTWAELTEVQKFFWWIVGKKSDDTALVRLQNEDKELLEKIFTTQLKEKDFSIPDPIDLSQLIELSKKAAVEQHEKTTEQVKVERWATEQVSKIEAVLRDGTLENASLLCKKVIQNLQDVGGRASSSVVAILEKCNKLSEDELAELNKKIKLIEARQFEFEIANLFRRKGYKSSATRFTNDDGVDVFASNENEKVIIQCKRWKHSVGRDKIDELAGVKNRYKVDKAILATTSYFSDDAKRAGREHNIELWDFMRIKREWHDALATQVASQ